LKQAAAANGNNNITTTTQQNNIININLIMNGNHKSDANNVIDLTLNDESTTMMNNLGKNILEIFNKPNIAANNNNNINNNNENINQITTSENNKNKKGGNTKVVIKYPIPDEELYKNPELHGVDSKCLHKPSGNKTSIPEEHFNRVIKIWDFINTYKEQIHISFFSPELLYNSLLFNKDEELTIINEIHISLLLIFLEELDTIELTDLVEYKDLLLLKIAIEGISSKRILLNKTWTEVLRIIATCPMYELMETAVVKDVSTRLKYITPSIYNTLTFDEKIGMLEFLVNTAVSTEFIKDIIKEHINMRNELNKEKSGLTLELKELESRKRELERAEKFTNPKTKVESLNKRLSTLVEDNAGLSRQELTKLRKSIEQEREEFSSVKVIIKLDY
jgi:hypothetical protein